jgi:NADH-quinone oxidoreductase subunit H
MTYSYPYQTPANVGEIFKFSRLTVIWLSIIFGAVWAACFLVGVAIPFWIDNGLMLDGGGLNLFQKFSEAPTDANLIWSNTFRALTPIVAVAVFIPINAMFMVLCERRALALFTVRKGPNRVGPDGLLQTAADAVKLLFKEDITPRGADILMFTLAPIIFFAPSIIGMVPLLAAVTNNHQLFAMVNIPTGIFYVIAVSAIPVVGIVMGGWASNNKYSLVGGLRSAAQAISYEIPLVLSIITVCLISGTLDVVSIAERQAGGILHWNIFAGGALPQAGTHLAAALDNLKNMTTDVSEATRQAGWAAVNQAWGGIVAALTLVGCMFTLFGIYATCACAEINRIPFDLPEAESELVSGYNTEYSGIKFAIFFLAEFTNLFVVSSIATVLFLGGGSSPIQGFLDAQWWNWLVSVNNWKVPTLPFINPETFFGAFWVIIKVYSLVVFAILVRGTLPRFRIDQLMDFGWKRLIPLSLILLLAVTFLRELV